MGYFQVHFLTTLDKFLGNDLFFHKTMVAEENNFSSNA